MQNIQIEKSTQVKKKKRVAEQVDEVDWDPAEEEENPDENKSAESESENM